MNLINNIKIKKFNYNNFVAYFIASIIGPIVNILINPVLAKNLSHQDYTIIGYFTSFNLLIVPLLSFNLITYYLKSYNNLNAKTKNEFESTILIGVAISGFISLLIITFIFSNLLKSQSTLLFFPNGFYCFAQLYLSSFYTLFLLKIRLENNVKKYITFSLSYVVIYTFATLFFVVYLRHGATGKFQSAFLVSIVYAIISFYLFIYKKRFFLNFKILINALKFGLPLTISALLWYFLVGVDKLFLIELNDTINYGNYIVATQIIGYMGIFYTSLNNTFEADIFKMISEKKYKSLLKVYALIMVIIIMLNILLLVFSPFVIDFLTAGRYNDSVQYLKILCLMNIAMVAYYLSIKLLVANGFVATELFARIISALFSIVLFKILINSFGFYGAAWGQVFSFLIAFIITASSFYYKYRNQN